METVRVGIVGSRFMANIHASTVRRSKDAVLVGVASPTEEHVRSFAERHAVERWHTDWRELVARPDVDMVVVCTPNRTHAPIAIEAARRGKHVVVEKPLAVTVEEAEAMVLAARESGVKLMYAEEFCFAPQYVRARQVVEEGGVGALHKVHHVEKYQGSTSPLYWDLDLSGGWCAMQLGSHSLGIIRWMLGKPKAISVQAVMRQVLHKDRGPGEDDSIMIVEFDDGSIGVAENSWARSGGMDDRLEVYGTAGTIYASLYQEGSLRIMSEPGYRYSAPGRAPTQGWTWAVYDELHNNGFPQEIDHFIDCVKNDRAPQESGEDGMVVLEIISAAYESARLGRKVSLEQPFRPGVRRPIDCWLGAR